MVNIKTGDTITISYYSVFFAVFSFICILLTYFLPASNSPESFYTILSLASLLEVVVFLFCNGKSSGGVLNFATIFVAILYLFHFGQVILLGLFPKSASEMRIVLNYFTFQECSYALRILNVGLVLICCGILISSRQIQSEYLERDCNGSIAETDLNEFKNKAFFVLLITFPVKLYIDLKSVYLTLTMGFNYSKEWYYSISDFIVTFGGFSQVCVAVLFILYKTNRKTQFRFFVIVLCYIMLTLLSGRRSESVAFLCLVLYIFFETRNTKIKASKLIIYGLLGYFILGFLYSVVYMRSLSGSLLSSFFDRLWYSLTKGNIIFQALREYGNTGYTAICVLVKWLPNNSPSLGKSYIYGVSAVFPNIFGLAGQLTRESVFGEALQKAGALSSAYTNIGGSVMGEAYFNFGILGGSIFLFIVGKIVSKVSARMKEIIKGCFDYRCFYYITLMIGLIYWVRSYFSGNVRDVVWAFLLFYVLKNINIRLGLGNK